ncbi:hypothetical protein TRIUR3_35279 [Triticum urartu]|uniref:Uncharacterized protein n=1 Tax=Triticum urartu TaxID=4572 RepID=M8ACZ4_TRIUA|nr:hypothetical protein TRIUR3_35279 [Triticum urartu]
MAERKGVTTTITETVPQQRSGSGIVDESGQGSLTAGHLLHQDTEQRRDGWEKRSQARDLGMGSSDADETKDASGRMSSRRCSPRSFPAT